eukprot:jgi/Chlat1/7484/Chrsp60S06994
MAEAGGGDIVTVALDWTPNTNHTGFFVAQAKGLYEREGLRVQLISPHEDEYKATPASRVDTGQAHFAISPSETVISYRTQPKDSSKSPLIAVAAILQTDTSAIVTLKSSGKSRPRDLDGAKYASYGARFEGRIVQELIRADGGKGEYEEVALPMLGIWNTALKGRADATWVFEGWEGIEARRAGVELNYFRLGEYNDKPDLVKRFLKATAEGFQFAASNPSEAASILVSGAAEQFESSSAPLAPLDLNLVRESQEFLAKHMLNGQGKWGLMNKDSLAILLTESVPHLTNCAAVSPVISSQGVI